MDPNNACFSGTKHQNEPRLYMQLVSGKGSTVTVSFFPNFPPKINLALNRKVEI